MHPIDEEHGCIERFAVLGIVKELRAVLVRTTGMLRLCISGISSSYIIDFCLILNVFRSI